MEKKKANELFTNFFNNDVCANIGEYAAINESKICAMYCVDEIVKEVKRLDDKFNLGLDGTKQFWDKVKNEIENINDIP